MLMEFEEIADTVIMLAILIAFISVHIMLDKYE